MVGHGAYVEWPARVDGAQKIINIRSNANDCVTISIPVSFIHEKFPYRARREPDRALMYYRHKVREMNFPPHLTLPHTIHDFPETEKSVRIDVWLCKRTNDPN